LPHGLAEKKKSTLVLQLVDTLVSQLDGKLEIESNPGALFKISIKLQPGTIGKIE
jgi:two-component sensor histidine kinase